MLEQPNISKEIEKAGVLFRQLINDSRDSLLLDFNMDFIDHFNVTLCQLGFHIKLSYIDHNQLHLGFEPHFIEVK